MHGYRPANEFILLTASPISPFGIDFNSLQKCDMSHFQRQPPCQRALHVAVMEVLTLDVPEDAMHRVFSKNVERLGDGSLGVALRND